MEYYPLSDSFVAVSFLGFIASVFLTFRERISISWGVPMIILFLAFVVASFITLRSSVYGD
jgi:hypothetical protein